LNKSLRLDREVNTPENNQMEKVAIAGLAMLLNVAFAQIPSDTNLRLDIKIVQKIIF